jgi:hypothetical protein
MDDFNRRQINKSKPCKDCRAAMMTFTVEERQKDGTWIPVKITRNCGHEYPTDPQFN